ncbi:hypothetical protein D3C76_1330010 [compost metagenome]
MIKQITEPASSAIHTLIIEAIVATPLSQKTVRWPSRFAANCTPTATTNIEKAMQPVISGLFTPRNVAINLGPSARMNDVDVIPGPKNAMPNRTIPTLSFGTLGRRGLNEPVPSLRFFCSISASKARQSSAISNRNTI